MSVKVFVSYPRDAYLGQYIENSLEEIGYEVLSSIKHIPIGSNFAEQTRRSIERSDIFIAIIIEDNPNVYMELGLSMGSNKKAIIIAPEIKILPSDFSGIKIIRYSELAGLMKQEEFDNLLNRIVSEMETWICPHCNGSGNCNCYDCAKNAGQIVPLIKRQSLRKNRCARCKGTGLI